MMMSWYDDNTQRAQSSTTDLCQNAHLHKVGKFANNFTYYTYLYIYNIYTHTYYTLTSLLNNSLNITLQFPVSSSLSLEGSFHDVRPFRSQFTCYIVYKCCYIVLHDIVYYLVKLLKKCDRFWKNRPKRGKQFFSVSPGKALWVDFFGNFFQTPVISSL